LTKKTYVIDTNIILDDPYIIGKLDGRVVIPTTVLHELDDKKFGSTEKNRNSREFARIVDSEEFEVIFVDSDNCGETNDQKIIECALNEVGKAHNVILLTNDIYMSILAKSKGLKVERGGRKKHISDKAYTGINKELPDNPNPNEYNISPTGILRYGKNEKWNRIGKDIDLWGVRHKNAEQRCAIDALLDDNIKLVTLSGRAGTGKTLLSIAAGLEKVIGESKYQKLLVSRPIVPMGNEIGFLPGDINDKLGPWMQPIFDNIDFLFNLKSGSKKSDNWMALEREGLLKLEPLTYIRGRSIPDQFIIIDEAQNLSKHEIKTILSRAGDNTKIVLTGDPDQIDNPRLDSINNGLSYVIERFKDQSIAAHITFSKCERSELADISTKIL